MLQPGDTIGEFRVEARIGQGGMGVVYRASQPELEREVALKVIAADWANDPRLRAMFAREARLAAAAEHPNVLPVYGAGEAEGVLYLVMRFIDGVDLERLLRLEGPLDPGRAVAILAQTAAGLDAAHRRGLVHRDVKPRNILIAAPRVEEHVYLSDFGLARLAHQASTLLGRDGRPARWITWRRSRFAASRSMPGPTSMPSAQSSTSRSRTRCRMRGTRRRRRCGRTCPSCRPRSAMCDRMRRQR